MQSTNDTGVTHRRSPRAAGRLADAHTRETYASAIALHDVAAGNYRRALHKYGAVHATTLAALEVATVAGLYLTDARTRYRRTIGRAA